MVKILFFVAAVLGIMFYPVVVSNNETKKTHKNNLKIKNLPDVQVENGKFFIYNKLLEKKGDFEKLNIYKNKNKYVAFKLNADNVLTNEKYKSPKTILNGDLITGYDVWYKNKDYELKTVHAVYNQKSKILRGGQFKVFSKNFRGYGKKFKVDDKQDIYSQNITYYIKVEK